MVIVIHNVLYLKILCVPLNYSFSSLNVCISMKTLFARLSFAMKILIVLRYLLVWYLNRETCYYYLTISKFNVFVCLIYVFEFFICSCRRVVKALEQVLHVQLKLHLPISIYWPPFLDTSNITMGRQACFYIWLKILLSEHMHTYNKVLCKYIEEIQNQHTHIYIFDIK